MTSRPNSRYPAEWLLVLGLTGVTVLVSFGPAWPLALGLALAWAVVLVVLAGHDVDRSQRQRQSPVGPATAGRMPEATRPDH